MKIMLANVAIAKENDDFAVNHLSKIWKENFNLVRRPDTEIFSKFSDWGIIGMEGFFYPAIDLLNSQAVLQSCLSAEKEGFDGILITCFGDPMLDQIRSLVNIPVISIGEASLYMAAIMAKKFGLVVISEANIHETWHKVNILGLKDFCAGIQATPEPPQKQPEGLIHASETIDSFITAGKPLINQGAEILIPCCGLMSPALRIAPGCENSRPHGLTQIDQVPIMDVLSVSLQLLESMIILKKSGSPWISRRGIYRTPPQSALESGKMVLNDNRQKFWTLKLT